jgi:hypothetical protein
VVFNKDQMILVPRCFTQARAKTGGNSRALLAWPMLRSRCIRNTGRNDAESFIEERQYAELTPFFYFSEA